MSFLRRDKIHPDHWIFSVVGMAFLSAIAFNWGRILLLVAKRILE